MLQNHVENQWSIGTIAGAIQPVIVRNGLINVPKKALYSWEPTAMLGVYRIDEFHWDKTTGKEAANPHPLRFADSASPASGRGE
jgi:peptide/nickel transport system substrate-binding protein